MSLLRPYLWKEWREHRSVLAALALLLPTIVFATAFAAGRKVFDAPAVLLACGALGALAVAMTVGSEILSTEEGARLRFLERLPGGLASAFRAKLALFVGAVAALFALGVISALLAGRWRLGRWPDLEAFLYPEMFQLPLVSAGLALWVLAVSSWVPRGSLSLPLAGLVLAVLAWPLWLLGAGWWYAPTTLERVFLIALLVGGASITAAVGFVQGRARGRTKVRASIRSVSVAAATLAPAWVWGALRLHEHFTIDPNDDRCEFADVHVAENGRLAFLNASRESPRWNRTPPHALVVDLETGDWRDLGAGTYLEARDRLERAGGREHRVVRDCLLFELDPLTGHPRETPQRLDEVAGKALALPEGQPLGEPAGLGHEGGPGHRGQIWDPFRSRYFSRSQLLDQLTSGRESWEIEVLVAPSGWLLHDDEAPAWQLLDPLTGASVVLDWPDDETYRHPMLPDGRVFLNPRGELHLGDPANGTLVRVDLPGERVFEARISNAYDWGAPFREGQPVLLDAFLRGWLVIDAELLSGYLVPVSNYSRPCALLPDGSLAVVEQEEGFRLVALDLWTEERRVLFPRP